MNDILSKIAVSLLVRLRVEILILAAMGIVGSVSLLVRLRVEINYDGSSQGGEEGQPPREAAS